MPNLSLCRARARSTGVPGSMAYANRALTAAVAATAAATRCAVTDVEGHARREIPNCALR